MRHRIRRPGAFLRLIRQCETGGGRAGVRKDPSEGTDKTVSGNTTRIHMFTHEIGVIGVRAERYVGVRCVTHGHISGELPELSVCTPTSEICGRPMYHRRLHLVSRIKPIRSESFSVSSGVGGTPEMKQNPNLS